MERLQQVFSVSYRSPQWKIEPGRRKISFFAGTVLCSVNKFHPDSVNPARG